MAGDQKGRHPGTSLMSKETEGKGHPPRTFSGKAECWPTSREFARARSLDAEGNEAACLNAVKSANRALGCERLKNRDVGIPSIDGHRLGSDALQPETASPRPIANNRRKIAEPHTRCRAGPGNARG
jgi:hypothetical protein